MAGIFTFVNMQPGLTTEPGIKFIVTTSSTLGKSHRNKEFFSFYLYRGPVLSSEFVKEENASSISAYLYLLRGYGSK